MANSKTALISGILYPIALCLFVGIGSHMIFHFFRLWNGATQSRKRLFMAAVATCFIYCCGAINGIINAHDTTHYSNFSIQMCHFMSIPGMTFMLGKGCGLMFYCFRVYETYRGSPLAYNERSIRSLLIIIAVFYVLETIIFQCLTSTVLGFFSDEARRELGPFNQWNDCRDVYYEYSAKPGYKILVAEYIIGEVILSIVVMRLYIRKLIIMDQSFDFADGATGKRSAIAMGATADSQRLSTPADGKLKIRGISVGLGEQSTTIEVDLKSGSASAEEAKEEPTTEVNKAPIHTKTGFRKELLNLATLTSNLVIITIISDFVILIIVSLATWIIVVDMVVNIICLYLTFGFSRHIYDRICVCHNCCFQCCIVGIFANGCRCGDECCDCDQCHTNVCCGEKKDIRSSAKRMTSNWVTTDENIEEMNEE